MNKLNPTQADGGLNSQVDLVPVAIQNRINDIENLCNTTPVAFLKKKKSRIYDLEKTEAFYTTLGVMFTKIANLAGIKGEIAEINKQDISKMILRRYKGLSIEEVYFAFEMERYGEYESKTGHFGLFNADYVSEILNKFKKWKIQMNVKFNISEKSYPRKKELTQKDRDGILEKGVSRFFEEYKKTKDVAIGCVYIYDFLRKKGRIKPHSEAYRNKIIEMAKKNLSKQKDDKGLDVLSIFCQEKTTGKQIENECKRLALKDFFSEKLK